MCNAFGVKSIIEAALRPRLIRGPAGDLRSGRRHGQETGHNDAIWSAAIHRRFSRNRKSRCVVRHAGLK